MLIKRRSKMTNMERFEELILDLMDNTGQEVLVSGRARGLIQEEKIKAADAYEFIMCCGALVFKGQKLSIHEVGIVGGEIENIKLSVSVNPRFMAFYLEEEESEISRVIRNKYSV
jgi:hypothetical protein